MESMKEKRFFQRRLETTDRFCNLQGDFDNGTNISLKIDFLRSHLSCTRNVWSQIWYYPIFIGDKTKGNSMLYKNSQYNHANTKFPENFSAIQGRKKVINKFVCHLQVLMREREVGSYFSPNNPFFNTLRHFTVRWL